MMSASRMTLMVERSMASFFRDARDRPAASPHGCTGRLRAQIDENERQMDLEIGIRSREDALGPDRLRPRPWP